MKGLQAFCTEFGQALPIWTRTVDDASRPTRKHNLLLMSMVQPVLVGKLMTGVGRSKFL